MNIQETIALVKEARQSPSAELAKAYTQSGSATSGITAYDLEAPAKKLYPVPTLLRNLLGRVTGGKGIQANWRSVTAINTGGLFGGVGEGQRGGILQQTTTDNLAAFRALGMDNSVTFEADYAAEGFDDAKALAVQQTLESLMVAEEKIILFGNTTLALGTTPTPTVAFATTGGSIAAATYNVIAVALTGQGVALSSVAGGVVATTTTTSADGSSIVQDGGAAQQSAAAAVTPTGSTAVITASVAAVRGAMGYAWYVGASGSEKLAAITTINSVSITAIPTTTQAASALPASDKSTNSLIFDGLLTLALKSGSGATYVAQPTGTAGVGTPLTADGAGGIKEFDAVLKSMYDGYKLSPDMIFVSSQQAIDIKAKMLSAPSGSVPAFRFNFETNQGVISGGGAVASYFNPYGSATGVDQIKIVVHPFMPDGTILFFSTKLPYQMSNVGAVARILCRRDYYQIEWPLRTRKWEYGVYSDEVLQHYAPFSMGVITNIAKG